MEFTLKTGYPCIRTLWFKRFLELCRKKKYMKHIFIIGAGRSSYYLIRYLLEHAPGNWTVTVGDVSLDLAKEKVGNHSSGSAISFDIHDADSREKEIAKADLVISMLPAFMHVEVARDCVRLKKHLVTASYVSPEMQALNADASAQGLILLNECGLDPGIDHMSAMKAIHEIRGQGGRLTAFRSYTGGLVAPESNDNPWGYKFSWNPRNVILAGQGTATFIEHGEYRYLPYNRLFTQTETIQVDGCGEYEGYANRDSLAYRKIYGLEDIPTLIRGTLREKGYCRAWNVFVRLGLTDDNITIENSQNLTYAGLLNAFLPERKGKLLPVRLAEFMEMEPDDSAIQKVVWTGITSEEIIGLDHASPAQILQHLLEAKWKLRKEDRDLVVMQHIFEFEQDHQTSQRISSLIVKGENSEHTGMARTVGLPVAIASKLILEGKIKLRGVVIPVHPEIYLPVLAELSNQGIHFDEKVSVMH